MTELSPAAQAVLDAYIRGLASKRRNAIAAALRAAAVYCKRDRLILLSLADELKAL